MPSLWFIVPIHGRLELASICLRQLRRTCDALRVEGVETTAVLIGERDELNALPDLGFGAIERNNLFLSRKFNDGIQLATDPAFNPRPADYVVPCGSDDWVDHRLFLDLPGPDTIHGFQRMSFVREDGEEIGTALIDYPGGCGIRIYPRELMADLDYRPADEDRPRGCDTSILTNMRQAHEHLRIVHADLHDRQIVDWKSPSEQLNSYGDVGRRIRSTTPDPFSVLADFFPAEALEEMREHYARRLIPA